MKEIKVKRNQTIFDVALEQYGTCEAVGEIMANNPGLRNDPKALTGIGIDALQEEGFYIDVALERNMTVLIDAESKLIDANTVKGIENEITNFDL